MSVVHPKYHEAVLETLTDIRHKKTVDLSDALFSSYRGVNLWIEIDSKGNISKACHSGATGAELAVMERLCRISIGRPIQEASEHGMIYVEYGMRDTKFESPVKGLLNCENGDPIFNIGKFLIRDCYRQFQQTKATDSSKNFWYPSANESWVSKSFEEKKEMIQGAINDAQALYKFFDLRFEVLEIQQETRVVVSVSSGRMNSSQMGHAVMKVELELKKHVEPQLELILESTEDRNKRLDRTHISRGA